MPSLDADTGDGARMAYKVFMDSPGGKELLQYLLSREIAAQAEGRAAKTIEEKGLAMVKLNDAYDIRTHLEDMSKPALSQAVRSAGSN